MKKIFLTISLILLLIGTISFIFKFKTLNTETSKPGVIGCTMEAKMCPDGVTYVGRQGPKCEFQACPEVSNSDLILIKGDVAKMNSLTISLNSILQDSRCPVDVQCIQAGSVKINITLTDDKNTETRELASDGSVLVFSEYKIFITNVLPVPKSTIKISEEDYKVTLHIQKS